ncbi:MAG: choice-of-anchor V domain-containing protein [Candidatus Krumholzibacteriia bacterium]|nr:T9SS type A sorting domain-containing protein [bacterium]MCB9517280.1 T9SS type A sorting domain-containing protein [Candidatus Latescibacterota bacterium]
MRLSRPLFVTLLALFALLVAMTAILDVEMAMAYPWGPFNGKTGAPGEGTCRDCHGSFPLDSGSGSFGESCVSGAGQYVPGDTYTICIDLSDPQASRWGFEITLLDAAGDQAGTLTPVDGNTQVGDSLIAGHQRQYGKHTLAGTAAGTTGGHSWMMEWQAPATGTGTVTLYGMGNAANNDDTILNDYIYSMVLPLAEAEPTGVGDAVLAARLEPNFPNPFNPKTRLSFTLDQPSSIRLSVYDSTGRLVRVVHSGPVDAGAHSYTWDGRDTQGQASPSGVYFSRLQDNTGLDLDAAQKMTLVK